MNREIAFFDLDGTLWNIKSEIWLIDKENPQRPIVKIDSLEFSLIKNGLFKKDDIPLDYNGQRFYISKKLYNKVYKRKGFENLDRLGISFHSFYDKEKLEKAEKDFLVDNISHLRGKKVHVGLLTARSSQKTHSNILNDLRLVLKNMNISLDKIYFTGDKFKVYHDDMASLKKVHILLEHLIGFKIKNNKFIPIRQDWYNEVHFYDDVSMNIDYADECQSTFNDLLKGTDDDLFNIIIERVNSEELKMYTHLITNNEINRFKDNMVKLVEPEKFPLKLEIKKYSDFSLVENVDFENFDWEEEEPIDIKDRKNWNKNLEGKRISYSGITIYGRKRVKNEKGTIIEYISKVFDDIIKVEFDNPITLLDGSHLGKVKGKENHVKIFSLTGIMIQKADIRII